MTGNGNRKGEVALLTALAAGSTITDAAEQAGISERTAHRRLADPEFRRRAQAARADLIQRALGKLAANAGDAVDTLGALLCARSESAPLGAARTILEVGNKLRESVELEQRLADLEQRFASEEKGQ
jgi:hypothetical protein